MFGCEYHGQSEQVVLRRWKHPAVEKTTDLQLCSCCSGPAVGAPKRDLGDGVRVSPPVLCSRCVQVTQEQARAIYARLNYGREPEKASP
jgi:hypothetical protein